MTPEEFRAALEHCSSDVRETVYAAIFEKYGGRKSGTVDEYVSDFVALPNTERGIVHILRTWFPNLKAEDEKVVEASVRSADAAQSSAKEAKRSADAAVKSATWSKRAVIVAIIAAAIALLALVFSTLPEARTGPDHEEPRPQQKTE